MGFECGICNTLQDREGSNTPVRKRRRAERDKDRSEATQQQQQQQQRYNCGQISGLLTRHSSPFHGSSFNPSARPSIRLLFLLMLAWLFPLLVPLRNIGPRRHTETRTTPGPDLSGSLVFPSVEGTERVSVYYLSFPAHFHSHFGHRLTRRPRERVEASITLRSRRRRRCVYRSVVLSIRAGSSVSQSVSQWGAELVS